MSSAKSQGAMPEKTYYSLEDAAVIAGCSPKDLLHYAVQRKISLLIGVPDWVDIRIYDETANAVSEPFLLKPQLLVLTQSQCQIVELNGRTQQSDFSEGYLLEPTGDLKKILPSYGRRELNHQWAFWRTFQSKEVCLLDLIPTQLIVMRCDLHQLVDPVAKSKVPVHAVSKKNQTANKVGFNAVDTTIELSIEPVEISPDIGQAIKIESQKSKPIEAAETMQKSDQKSNPLEASSKSNVILRLKQVQLRTGLSRSTIYDRMKINSPRHDPTFPKQFNLGGDAVGWVEADIEAWVQSRVNSGRIETQ